MKPLLTSQQIYRALSGTIADYWQAWEAIRRHHPEPVEAWRELEILINEKTNQHRYKTYGSFRSALVIKLRSEHPSNKHRRMIRKRNRAELLRREAMQEGGRS